MTSPEAVTGPSTTEADRLIARIERVPVSRFHWRVVGTLGTGTFFDAFDIVAIGVVLTAVSGTFHLDSAQAGWLVSAGFLGQGIGAVGFGLVSERFGRRTVFLTALLLIGSFAAVSVASWSGFSLGAIRLLQGLGLGAEVPVASALLAELVTGPRRGRVSVLYKLASPLGNLTGSLVAAALLAATPPSTAWRLLFAIGAAPLLVAAVAAVTLPESPRFLVRRGRYAEAEAIVTAMETSAGGRLPAPAGRVAPADLRPTRFGELFSPDYARRTRLVWVLWFTCYFVLLGATVWLPNQFVKVGHVSQSRASLLAGSIVVGVVLLILVVAALVERVGRKPLLIAGYVVALLGGLAGIACWLTGNLHSWLPLYLAGLLLLLGVGMIDPLVYAYTAELFPTRMRSWASLSASAWRAVAAVIAPIVIGQLLQAGLGIGVVFVLFTVVVLIGLTAQAGWGIETKQAQLERLAR